MADERERRRKDDIEDEAPPEKGKEKKEKKSKEEKKEKKEKEPRVKKEEKEKKSHPVLKTLLNTSIFWLVCILVFSALTYLNIFSLKEVVLQALNPEDDYEVIFESDIIALQDYETEQDKRAADNDAREAELNDYENNLIDRETDLDQRESELEEKYPNALIDGTQVNANTDDIIATAAKAVAAMEPKKAAEALVVMGQDTAVAIMKMLKAGIAGPILNQMTDTDRAMFIELMAEIPTE